MPGVGAPIGNDNVRKGKVWRAAINRALTKRGLANQRDELDALADKLLDQCSAGELAALKELGDRLDGKAAQAIVGGDDGDNPVQAKVTVEYIGAPPAPSKA